MVVNKRRGDTLIEVTLAVGIFSMVAIAAVAVLSGGTSSAQTALEATLAREEIDAQSEAIRFIQSAALAENGAGGGSAYTALYDKIAELAKGTSGYTGTNNKSCNDMYNNDAYKTGKAFIINTHALSGYVENYNANGDKAIDDVLVVSTSDNREEGRKKLFRKTQTYPHLIYGNDATNTDKDKLINDDLGESDLYAAAGIYVVAVADNGTTKIVDDKGDLGNDKKGFDDFYVQTCWYGSGSDTASTISTVIRLYNPQADIAQGTSIYTIYYNGNEDADAHSGGAMSRTYNMTNSEQTTTVLANSYTKLCYDPITVNDILGNNDNRPIWTTKSYYEEWKNENKDLFDPDGENLYGNVYGDRDTAMNRAHYYLREKEESYIDYLRRKLKSEGDAYYSEGDKIKIPENKGSNQYITLFAQWHKDYNHNVCSPLYVSYTDTGKSPGVSSGEGESAETPTENLGATQGFIVPDERAWNNKELPAVAAIKERDDYAIARTRLKFPVSTCRTSSNDWKFISDDNYRTKEETIYLGDVLGGTKIKNITNFDLIATARFNSGNLYIKKKNGDNTVPLTVFFNIACLAPSMQADVDLEYCLMNAYDEELQVRDERDNSLYYVLFDGVGGAADTYTRYADLTYEELYEEINKGTAWLPLGDYVGLKRVEDEKGRRFYMNPKRSSCIMTQNLRFEGNGYGGEDITYTEKEVTDKETNKTKIINVGSNVGEGFSKELTETVPGKEESDDYTWRFKDGEARYISSKYLVTDTAYNEWWDEWRKKSNKSPSDYAFPGSEGISGAYEKSIIEAWADKTSWVQGRFYKLTFGHYRRMGESLGIKEVGRYLMDGTKDQKVKQAIDVLTSDIGTWYNYYAAFPGGKVEKNDGGITVDTDTYDICPAGWHVGVRAAATATRPTDFHLLYYDMYPSPIYSAYRDALGYPWLGYEASNGWWIKNSSYLDITNNTNIYGNNSKFNYYDNGFSAYLKFEFNEGGYAIASSTRYAIPRGKYQYQDMSIGNNYKPKYVFLRIPEITEVSVTGGGWTKYRFLMLDSNDSKVVFTDYPVYTHVRCIRSE